MEDEEVEVHARANGRKMKAAQGRKELAQGEVLQSAQPL